MQSVAEVSNVLSGIIGIGNGRASEGRLQRIMKLLVDARDCSHARVLMDYVSLCTTLDDIECLLESVLCGKQIHQLYFWDGCDDEFFNNICRYACVIPLVVSSGHPKYLLIVKSTDEFLDRHDGPVMILRYDSDNNLPMRGSRRVCVTRKAVFA